MNIMNDTYERTVGRIQQMISYQETKEQIHDRLASEGMTEDLIFFAYVGAVIMSRNDNAPFPYND